MGCVNSKTDINDRHPNIFQVTNVNEQGKPISPGKLQVTETELVFYQRGKSPTKWPLRSLRKYGFDIEVFSFECGRRCPTGHGIYAFKCRKAEQLFNIVQHYIIGNINEEIDPLTGVPIPSRRPNTNIQSEGYLNPIIAPVATGRTQSVVSRPGSVSSNGPLSPVPVSPPPDLPVEHNNNKRCSILPEPTYTNSIIMETNSHLPHYANIKAVDVVENHSHVYMNVDTSTKDATKDLTQLPEETEERHCYANIDTKDIENLRSFTDNHFNSIPPTPTIPYAEEEYKLNYVAIREVNYAELDLDAADISSPTGSQAVPDSPKVEKKKSYATIDFQKTTALSQSLNPTMAEEEGIRKTRHNSTIHYNSD